MADIKMLVAETIKHLTILDDAHGTDVTDFLESSINEAKDTGLMDDPVEAAEFLGEAVEYTPAQQRQNLANFFDEQLITLEAESLCRTSEQLELCQKLFSYLVDLLSPPQKSG